MSWRKYCEDYFVYPYFQSLSAPGHSVLYDTVQYFVRRKYLVEIISTSSGYMNNVTNNFGQYGSPSGSQAEIGEHLRVNYMPSPFNFQRNKMMRGIFYLSFSCFAMFHLLFRPSKYCYFILTTSFSCVFGALICRLAHPLRPEVRICGQSRFWKWA